MFPIPWQVDWQTVFVPSTPLLEILIRGTVTYLALFILLRGVLKREAGAVGMNDLLVVVLIADAAQNAMGDDYRSITDGVILVSVIIFWAWFLDWLGFHVPWFQRLVRPPPLLLVEDGVILRGNLRKELLTHEELMSLLRQQGVEDIKEVWRAFMEENGTVSVITHDSEARSKLRKRRIF